MTQTNGHIDPDAGCSFAGWPRDEVKLFLQTIGRYVEDRIKLATAPLLKRIDELEQRKFSGVHQRALSYKCGAQVVFDGGLWFAIADVAANESPGSSPKWQLAYRHIEQPRAPTKGGPHHETIIHRRT